MPEPREHIEPNTFLKYHVMYRFLARSLNGEELFEKLNNFRIQIRIFTKVESIRPCDIPNVSTKFPQLILGGT